MAWRMAGRLSARAASRCSFFPCRQTEAAVLQERAGDHRHQRVSVQPGPRPALEMVEPQLFLQLLVRLLARPAHPYRDRQDLEPCPRRQVRQIVFALAGCTVLADHPGLFSQHVRGAAVTDPLRRPVCHLDAPGREPRAQPPPLPSRTS